MKYWWERYPGLEQSELDSLRNAGIAFKKDPDAWNAGKLVLHVEFPVKLLNLDFPFEKDNLLLDIIYPDTYPFLKPEVFAREESFQRHQHLLEKNLCLIGRSTEHWESDWPITDFLKSQLPKILKIEAEGVGSNFSNSNEEHQGEPFSEYLPYPRKGEVFYIGNWTITKDIKYGFLEIGNLSSDPIRGVVCKVKDENNNIIINSPTQNIHIPNITTVPWIRITEPIVSTSANTYIDAIIKSHPKHKFKNGKRFIGAVTFPEEGKWTKETDAWVFVIAEPTKNKRRSITDIKYQTYFVRSQSVDKKSLHDRIPELVTLNSKKALVFGLGSIGAPIALELARCGIGEIILIDYDISEVGPSVRWPFGFESSGKRKCEILREFINKNYPYVEIKTKEWRLGDVGANEIQNINDIIANTNIIIDATAEHGVNHFLSDYAYENKIPYIWAVGRPGGWGGIIGRIVPEKTEGCWLCYTHARLNNEIEEPPSSPDNPFQPTGCADPTFTGTSFDMTTIALTGVRMAIGTLCKEDENGYPDIEGDIISVAFRNNEGRAIPPTFTEDTIKIHKNCPCCSN